MTDISSDVAQRSRENRQRLVPEGPAPTGSALMVTNQNPFQYDWSQPPDGLVMSWHGSPDGELNAWKGRLAVDIDTPALYQNQDGATEWEEIGAGGGGTFADSEMFAGNTVTAVPHATPTALEMPPFGAGVPLLDVTNPAAPEFMYEGVYTLEASITTQADPVEVQLEYQVVRADGYVHATTDEYDLGIQSFRFSPKITVAVHPGDVFALLAHQLSGVSHDIEVVFLAVTWIGATVTTLPEG